MLRSVWLVLLVAAGTAAALGVATWSQLPDAVARLAQRREDPQALAVLAAAERSVVTEAVAGRVVAVAVLLDAYSGLVAPMGGGAERLDNLQRRTAAALESYAASREEVDVMAAGRALTLAADLDPSGAALARLRQLLLPPSDPEDGQVWVSPADGSALIWVPPLRFIMGCTLGDSECRQDERYLRWVEVPGVWVERSEVTNRRYRLCVEAGECMPPAAEWGFADPTRADEPVTGVSWHQARAYARWIGRRLPSESEWERCARGQRADARFPWGDGRLRGQANLLGRSGPDVFNEVAPAGSFPVTGWGHVDLAGNVWEWCEDTYHAVLTEGPREGQAWTEGGFGRVMRGGSWRRTVELARVSARAWQEPTYVADDVGFRCAADATGAVKEERLLAIANRVFPLPSGDGRVFDRSDLVAEDLRYLERRAVTWLVLEGRAWEALPWALVLLDRDQRDPVAVDLFGRLETQMVEEVGSVPWGQVEDWVERYRRAAAGRSALDIRRARVEKDLLRVLQTRSRELLQRGDSRQAAGALRVALTIAPEDPRLVNQLRATALAPGTPRTWPGDRRVMVWIPGGSFQMGRSVGDSLASLDEQPARTVWVEGFWLDRNEVTNADYQTCVDAGACTAPRLAEPLTVPALADHPVVGVGWYQARQYARWAGKRLPTEAEWERAARAGTSTRHPWGDQWRVSGGNAYGTREGDPWSGSAPVGSFEPNPWGLYDMLGNAAEWVEDVYHSDYRGAPRDGRAWTQVTGGGSEPGRVLRGGSFANTPPKLRVSQRDHRSPDDGHRTTGFRCAASE